MKKLKFFVFFLYVINIASYAAEKITVELSSDKITLEEEVNAVIRVETDADIEPKVSAEGSNAEIVASEYQGATTSTIYMNGQLSSKREHLFVVLLKAKGYGRAGLINISADIGGRVLRHDSLWFSVVTEKPDLAPVLLLAVPSKTRVYENEAILVRYYIMYQVDITSFDIKEFPKLNNFVKRYLQEQGNRERVSYEGKQFVRQLLYSLVLFPEKAKVLKLDPMKVNVTYDLDGERDPFGFGRGKLVTKTISSKTIDVEVLKLPFEKIPTGYTGLVGVHKFSLSINKTKVLVNEPIEIKLKVTGTGNLEGADAPQIIQDPTIESFDANSNFEIIDASNASKTFEYTYLPRKETRIPAQKIPLSFFNPSTKQFETAEVDFPGLEVVGGAYQVPTLMEKESTQGESQEKIRIAKPAVQVDQPKFSGPILERSSSAVRSSFLVNLLLMVAIFSALFKLLLDSRSNFPWVKPSKYKQKLKTMAEQGISYSGLEDLFLTYPKSESNISLKNKIEMLPTSQEHRKKLAQLLETLNSSYTKDHKAENNIKALWNNYKNDLCLLVQTLELWEDKKKKESYENSRSPGGRTAYLAS